MKMISRVALTTALVVPLFAGPAAAQNYRWDFGVNGGYSWYSDLLDVDDLLDETVPGNFGDAKFDAGWLVGTQLGYWIRPNIGLRLNGTYTDRPLDSGDFELIENINLWSGSLDFMWRFANRPNTEWRGTEILPYLALGLGAKWINPAGDSFACIDDDGDDVSCAPFVIPDDDDLVLLGPFAMEDQTRFMGLVGLGTDVRLAPSFALRLEVSDRIYKPKVFELDDEFDELVGSNLGNTVHEVAGQLGLHVLFGLRRPEVVSVIPAPAPPPPPPPPPPPAEEAISVCVIDPSVPNGIEMRSAYYRPASRDTVVIRNGDRVDLGSTVATVRTVRDADWFVRGEPLVLRVGTETYEFHSYQGSRVIDVNRVTYLGTINGYPVYADRDEVADVIDDLEDLRRSRNSDNLGMILENRNDLRDRINEVSYLYAPVEPVGCVFQALQPMEPVEKK